MPLRYKTLINITAFLAISLWMIGTELARYAERVMDYDPAFIK